MSIVSKPPSDAYKENWDRIFGSVSKASAENRQEALSRVQKILFNWTDSLVIEERSRLDHDLYLLDDDMVDIGNEIEAEFRITVPFETSRNWSTVADIVTFVINHNLPQ